MLTKEGVNKIIELDNPNVDDMIGVIEFYVFELKKEKLLDINIPGNQPCIVNGQFTTQLQLCYHMYNICVEYYKNQNKS